jgi:hypothetical protein
LISRSMRTSKPKDTRKYKELVSFDFEIRLESDIEIMRISKSGH